jgi:glycosyltransferase involved in cell wall biosynthesis
MKVALIRGPTICPWDLKLYTQIPDVELSVIASRKSRNISADLPVTVHRLPCLGEYFQYVPFGIKLLYKTLGDPQHLLFFNQAVGNIDLLHAAEIHYRYTYQAVLAKRKGLVKAVTATVFENIFFPLFETEKTRRIKAEIIAGTDIFFAVTQTSRQVLEAEGVKPEKIVVTPYGVDILQFKPSASSFPLRKRLHIPTDAFVILSVGRFVWEKGWYDLLRALKIISQSDILQPIYFIGVGTGIEAAKITAFAQKLGIRSRCIFVPHVAHEQIQLYYQTANVFVLGSLPTPYWNEQFGQVLIEAMASELPIVASQNGENQAVVGAGAWYYPPQDAFALADALRKLMLNPRLCALLGKRNRLRAENNFDDKKVSRTFYNVWTQLLKR